MDDDHGCGGKLIHLGVLELQHYLYISLITTI